MNYYPVYLNLKGRSVLLIGAGSVALQKLDALLRSQADIHVVAPEALEDVQALARDGKIKWARRDYRTSDLKGAFLVIAATDDPALQKRVAKESRDRHIWVNVVDVPPLCDFIAPAVASRGDVQIAISTGGAAPALAKHLRKKMESWIGQEYGDFVDIIKQWRPAILKLPKEKRLMFWERTINDSFIADLQKHGATWAEKRIKEWIDAD